MGITMKQQGRSGQEFGQSQRNENLDSQRSEDLFARLITKYSTVKNTSGRIESIILPCSRCGKNFPRKIKEFCRGIRRGQTTEESVFFCSMSCKNVGGTYLICPRCGGRKAQNATCCRKCYYAGSIEQLACSQCGVFFDRHRSEIRKSLQRQGSRVRAFCSKDCYDSSRYEKRNILPPPLTGVCLTCLSPCLAKRKYCSKDCYQKRKALNKEYVGEWTPKRRAVMLRDKGVCAYCERTKQRMQIHHINQDATDHDMKNLIALCQPCHNHFHHTASESVRVILSRYFKEKAIGL